jgi:hypothetical protein
MEAERAASEDVPPVETDRDEAARPVRAERPFKPRPSAERVDVAETHRELAARYPTIRARLAE